MLPYTVVSFVSDFRVQCKLSPPPPSPCGGRVAAGPCSVPTVQERTADRRSEPAWVWCRRIRTRYGIRYSYEPKRINAISVVVQNFIFDVHDARRAFATGPTAHAAPGTHSRCTLYDLMTVTRPG